MQNFSAWVNLLHYSWQELKKRQILVKIKGSSDILRYAKKNSKTNLEILDILVTLL